MLWVKRVHHASDTYLVSARELWFKIYKMNALVHVVSLSLNHSYFNILIPVIKFDYKIV